MSSARTAAPVTDLCKNASPIGREETMGTMLAAIARRLSAGACVVLCGIAAAHAQSGALYEQAKLEKTVALYGAGPPEPYQRWIADFEKAYPGVTVAFTGGLSNSLDKK